MRTAEWKNERMDRRKGRHNETNSRFDNFSKVPTTE